MSNLDPRPSTAAFDYQPESWMADAACVGYPATWWDLDEGHTQEGSEMRAAAKAIRAECPVRARCLDYALSVESGFNRYGMFGGTTPDARRKLSKAAS